MKKLSFLLVFLFATFFCNADSWIRKGDFPGGARTQAYGFSIGTKGYVGGGGADDLWEYDPATDTWVQKANPPFSSAYWPQGFSIGGYGYVFINATNKFWQYAPLTDTWTLMASVPGPDIIFPFNFVIGDKAYIGGGYNYITATSSFAYYNGFYGYDPATNTWSTLANVPFLFSEAFGFTANDKGYVNGVFDTAQHCNPEVFSYDPAANLWSAKADFPGIPRTDAATFEINSIAYFGVGDSNTGGIFKDWWQYNAGPDTWTQKESIPSTNGKDEDPAFSIDKKGYIFFGSDIYNNAEVWEYTPDVTTGVAVANGHPQFDIYPNPVSNTLNVRMGNEPVYDISISDVMGRVVASPSIRLRSGQALSPKEREVMSVDVSGLAPGVYFVKVNDVVRKFVKA